MEDTRTYRIEVHGRIDGGDLNAGSPLPVAVDSIHEASALLAVRTDQSGLIGLLRHLHTRGINLVAVITLPSPIGEG